VETTKKLGKATPPFLKYAASKTLAEQAAWKFVEENSPSFDIVTLLPTFVWGVSSRDSRVSCLKLMPPCSKSSVRLLRISRDLIIDYSDHSRRST
jgi:nucleoside-diphosphate-sugar epimerase